MADAKDVQLTTRKAIAFWKAIDEMPGSGLKLGVLRSIDLAMNKNAIEPIVVGWDKATADPVETRKMNEELQRVNRIFAKDPDRLAKEIDRVMEKYQSTIDEVDRISRERRDAYDAQHVVKLIMIPKSEFKCPEDSDKAAGVLYGLLPCIE